jgi:hypothetical protein
MIRGLGFGDVLDQIGGIPGAEKAEQTGLFRFGQT